MGGKRDPLGIVQEIEILPCYQMVCALTKVPGREWYIKFSEILRYKQITWSLSRRPDLMIINKNDRVGKGIHWELCKKMKFDHTTKWYVHKPKSVLENETHTILWDFEIQTDHLILVIRTDQEIMKNKKEPSE